MALMTIQLRTDPATGKKDIIVSLRPDEDALPHEHEQRHKQLVDKLIEGGAIKASEAGKVIVEREDEKEPATPAGTGAPAQPQAQGQGN